MPGTHRLFRWEDLPAIATVMNEYAQAMGSPHRVTVDEIEARWRAPYNHPERDCFVMEVTEGVLSGFTIADLLDDPAQANGVYFVPPINADAAEPLIRATEEHFCQMAQQAGVRTATMTYSLSDRDSVGVRTLEALGYTAARTFYTMQIILDNPVVMDAPPPDVILRPFDPSRDARAAYDAQRDAFQDHWNFHMPPFEEWMYDVEKPDFDPQHWWLAVVDDEIVGLALSEPRTSEVAWVGIVGVRPAWRRRGLGLLLLQRCFAIHQQQGRNTLRLGVDVDNRYQATALYERAGMSVFSRTLYFQRHFVLYSPD